jgi:hypothetical protein
MQAEIVPEHELDSLSAAVAAETGIPLGRVKKVLLCAQRLQRASPSAPDSPALSASPPALQADPLRFYPLGANGRTYPPLHQPRAGHADSPD